LYLFNIIENTTRNCETEDQKINNFLFEYEVLNKERYSLTSTVLKTDVSSISENKSIREHFKISVKFAIEISFDKLNEVLNPSNQVD